jgi:hypothetical protein
MQEVVDKRASRVVKEEVDAVFAMIDAMEVRQRC